MFLRLQGCNLLCKWPCDTIPVWRHGTQKTFLEILREWAVNGIIQRLHDGAHLILTGGEPMLRQRELFKFIQVFFDNLNFTPYIEVETNATIEPERDGLNLFVNQWNCSPKLSNSGMAKSRRIRPKAMQYFTDSPKATFKFVIDTPQDVAEMMEDYITPFNIQASAVYLMPECVNRAELTEKTRWVAELCKEHGFNFGNRLQIAVWNETTGC